MQQPLSHQQHRSAHPTHLKSQQSNGSLSAVNSFNHQFKPHSQHGQTQLEKQLLQPSTPQTFLTNSRYSSYSSSINGLMSVDENIGTKEQRRERKRKHNVKELFSTKRPRGSEKQASSSKSRLDKKSASNSVSDPAIPAVQSHVMNPRSPGNGPLLGVDPMLPANPFKVEGLPSSASNLDVSDKTTLDPGLSDGKKKRKRLKKKQDG